MEKLRSVDFQHVDLSRYGWVADLGRRVLIAAFIRLIQFVLIVDALIQRLGSAIGLPKIIPGNGSSAAFVRYFNRIAILGTIAFVTLVYESYGTVSRHLSVEVPILGYREADINLYYPPIGNNFMPKVPSYNVYSKWRPRTPLFIPFTRNDTMLQQAVLSYISAGWPRADIVIVDNSGTMDANNKHMLSKENPFYLDYDKFRARYGVSIVQTPTLLNFAQLQNFLLRVAITRDWPYYFWSHMDVVVLSAEEVTPYKSFYHRVIDILDDSAIETSQRMTSESRLWAGADDQITTLPSHDNKEVFAGKFDRTSHADPNFQPRSKLKKRELEKRKSKKGWAVKFFDFDNLALINVAAWRKIGQWDVFIPYYTTDCDAYSRMVLAGFRRDDVQAGHMFDVASVIQNPEGRFFPGRNQKSRNKWGIGPEGPEPEGGRLNSWRYRWLKSELNEMMEKKAQNKVGRNTWQSGAGEVKERHKPEPWTYDIRGFQAAWWATADAGREMYIKKWGTMECDLKSDNRTEKDVWLQEYLDEDSEEADVRSTSEEHWLAMLSEGPIR
jgi:hypothetical protein